MNFKSKLCSCEKKNVNGFKFVFFHPSHLIACVNCIQFNNSWYFLSDIRLTWREAADYCKGPPFNGHLIFIDSQEEYDLALYIDQMYGKYDEFWIGANDLQTEGDVT